MNFMNHWIWFRLLTPSQPLSAVNIFYKYFFSFFLSSCDDHDDAVKILCSICRRMWHLPVVKYCLFVAWKKRNTKANRFSTKPENWPRRGECFWTTSSIRNLRHILLTLCLSFSWFLFCCFYCFRAPTLISIRLVYFVFVYCFVMNEQIGRAHTHTQTH